MWLRDAVARGQAAHHRADDARPVPVLPLPLRPRALVATSASAGATRRSARSSRRPWPAASSRPSGGPSASPSSSSREQWRDAVHKQYLPEIGDAGQARPVADELADREAVEGDACTSPRPSRPTASQIAYFSEKDFYSVDLYLADGEHRQGEAPAAQVRRAAATTRRTASSTRQANWSPDGKYLAFAAKRGAQGRRSSSWTCDRNKDGQAHHGQARAASPRRPGARTASNSSSPGTTAALSDLFIVNARRHRAPAAHRRQVRRPAPGLVAGRQDRSRSPPTAGRRPTSRRSRSATSGSRSTTWRPGRSRVLDHMDAGQEREPAVVARRPVASRSCPTATASATSSCTTSPSDEVYQLTDFYTGVAGHHAAVAGALLGRGGRPAGLRVLRGRASTTSTASPIPRALKRAPYRQQAPDSVGILARAATPPLDTTRSLQVRGRRRGRRSARAARSTGRRRVPVLQRGGRAPATPTRPVAAGLHRRAARFGRLQPAGHQRVHPQEVPDQLHARLRRPARDRLRARQLRPRLLRRLGDLAQRHAGEPPAGLRRVRSTAGSTRPSCWRPTPT